MKRASQWPVVVIGLVSIPWALALVGCNDTDLPTTPRIDDPFPTLSVRATSTATQIEPGGFRIQIRMTVLAGLAGLDRAARTGAAMALTCRAGSCTDGPITPHFAEASCPAMLGGELAFGTAWLNGDTVGVDFCIPELVDGLVFETTVIDGFNRSNVVVTNCAIIGRDLLCGSG